MLNPTDAYAPNVEEAASEVIDGEAIIIHLTTGVYYSMAGIGGHIWSLIEKEAGAGAILEEILSTYDVTPEVAQRDLAALVQQLRDERLIVSARPMPFARRSVEAKHAYRAPKLNKYRDMEDLLALDPPAPGMNRITWKDESGG